MQQQRSIQNTFYTAIRWNTAGYIIQRALHTAISVYLYQHMSATSYVAWGTLLSILYLAIFFCDAGLRRSAPLYIDSYHLRTWFLPLYSTIGIMIATAITATQTWIIPYRALTGITYLLIPFIITQTLLIGMRVLYNSQLHNRQFAYIMSGWSAVEALCIVICIQYTHIPPIHILIYSKVFSGACSLIHAWLWAPSRNSSMITQNAKHSITRHTGYMWLISIMRSLSERHVIMPIIAWTAPAYIAATYKVLHETVMLLYRTMIKAIDVNDITILRSPTARRFAFFQLSTTLINWAGIALLGIACIPYLLETASLNKYMLVIIGYTTVCEVATIPWERLYEITYTYSPPLWAYTISCCIPIITLFMCQYILSAYVCSMVFLVSIHGIRTIALWAMAVHGMPQTVVYPWRYATLILSSAMSISVLCIYYAPH